MSDRGRYVANGVTERQVASHLSPSTYENLIQTPFLRKNAKISPGTKHTTVPRRSEVARTDMGRRGPATFLVTKLLLTLIKLGESRVE
jgi:hypothetical protein